MTATTAGLGLYTAQTTDDIGLYPVNSLSSSLQVLDRSVPYVINVKGQGYGAKGDGATDDTTAIRAAVAAVPSYGGVVYFPPGTYLINSPIYCTVNGEARITFQGGGAYAQSILKPVGGTSPAALLSFGGAVTSYSIARIAVQGMHHSGRDASGNVCGAHGIHIQGGALFTIRECSFESLNNGIRLTQGSGVLTSVGDISHNEIGSNNMVGIYAAGVAGVRITSNDLQEGRTGGGASSSAIYMQQQGARSVIADNVITSWEGYGILLSAAAGSDQSVTIDGNDISVCGGGMYLGSTAAVAGGEITALTGSATGIDIEVSGCTVNGVKITEPKSVGIRVAANNAAITGCYIRNPNTKGVDLVGVTECAVVGNTFADNTASAAMVNAVIERVGANHNVVVGNVQIGATGTAFSSIGASSTFANNVT